MKDLELVRTDCLTEEGKPESEGSSEMKSAMLNESVNDIMPGHISKNEVVVDRDHLKEAGYVGELPDFHLRIGNFMIWAQPAIYQDNWLRLKHLEKDYPICIQSSKSVDAFVFSAVHER